MKTLILVLGIMASLTVATVSMGVTSGAPGGQEVTRGSSTGSWFDMDLLDPGFYDEDVATKVTCATSTGSWFDMDLLDPGFYDN